MAAHLLAEVLELLRCQPALEECARVVAGRRVALEVHEVSSVVGARRVPEVVEADLVENRQRLVGGDVAAELRRLLVGADDRRDCVPADDRSESPLDFRVAVQPWLERRRDRVHVGRVERRDRTRAGVLRALDDAAQQLTRATRAVVLEDAVDRLEPFTRLERIELAGGAVG